MSRRSITIQATIAGISISGTSSRGSSTSGGEENRIVTLAAGSAGTLTTRTDNDTGVVTLTTGHGQTNGTYDIFWDTGSAPGIRRGMTGTIATNALTLDGGAGDNLPAQDTAVVIDKQEELDLDMTASTILMAVVSASRRGSVQFQEEDATVITSLDLCYDNTNEAWKWVSNVDGTTPFAENIGQVVVSNGSSAQTNTIKIAIAGS